MEPVMARLSARAKALLKTVRDMPGPERITFLKALEREYPRLRDFTSLEGVCNRYESRMRFKDGLHQKWLAEAEEKLNRRGYCSRVKRDRTALLDKAIAEAEAVGMKDPEDIHRFLKEHDNAEVAKAAEKITKPHRLLQRYRQRQKTPTKLQSGMPDPKKQPKKPS
jgi:hypothetical protein